MTTANRSFVIAVFREMNQAQQAMQDLMNGGFTRDQIRYSAQRGGGGIADDLVNMGIPRQEADFYNHEFEQGNTVVTVHANTGQQQQQAFNTLRNDGGYDFNTDQGRQMNYTGPATGTAGKAASVAPNAADIRAATTANASNVPPETGATNAPGDAAANTANAPNPTNIPGVARGGHEVELDTGGIRSEVRWVPAGEEEATGNAGGENVNPQNPQSL
ncbi:MAG TPA: hypothetical protein VKV40_07415 [Ktedonobacteraceae bacterium]|nr:hypothetical protein [Ktedonobacteraceae bacterium]